MPKKSIDIQGDGPFVRKFNALMETSELKNYELAEALGYSPARSNIITMFKKGLTRVPMHIVPALARALNTDPRALFRLWIQQYSPESLELVSDSMGNAATDNEMPVLHALRLATNGEDPKFTPSQIKRMSAIAEESMTEAA